MPSELVERTLRLTRGPGLSTTVLPSLAIARADARQPQVHSLHRPSVCFVVQGAKEVIVGSEVFRYERDELLFTSVDLPISGEVIDATARAPYLCLALEIDPGLVFELASAAGPAVGSTRAKRAIFVGQSDPIMTDAFLRLVRALDTPADARVLAPGVVREITYRLLGGPYGDAVRDVGIVGSQIRRIAKVIDHVKTEYKKPLRAEDLARIAGMSPSSFHQHFKQVTTLSPLQYQKRIRLQEARRLLLGAESSAADVAFEVGYESPSQFSREYARLFGAPPITDVKRRVAQ